MTTRRPRDPRSIATKAAELAVAVPQVMAHRMTRMAMAGPLPSLRDRKEFELMLAEKETAFVEGWQAMAAHTVRASHALAATLSRSFWAPAFQGDSSPSAVAVDLHDATFGVVATALAPMHRTAMANAKRLARTKLR
jgi:hypothetical protein